jgi:hypothetical protein
MLISFEGVSRPVELINCDSAVDHISAVLRGWQFEAIPLGAKAAPQITLRKTTRGYDLESPWQKKPLHHGHLVDAICSLIVDLVKAFIANDSSLLCLHCAAVSMAGRLVVFPNDYKAGKSILAAHFAAAGTRVYADDVLPIRPDGGGGVAPGVLPRLRLPLPDGLDNGFLEFVTLNSGLASKRFLYLDLDPGILVSHGNELPIGGFVLLDREPGAAAALIPVSESEMLKHVILKNFARDIGATEVLDRLHDLVSSTRCYRLIYGDAAQAVSLLRDEFTSWPSPAVESEPASFVTPMATVHPPGHVSRAPGIVEKSIDGESFLANPAGETIYHLNLIGTALWRILDPPVSRSEIIETLLTAFPDVTPDQIGRDVDALLTDLEKCRLIYTLAG